MSELNGIVTLGGLPEKEIFVELKSYDVRFVKEKIKGIEGFSKFLVENKIKDWFYNKTRKLRLDKFKRISKLLDISNIKIKKILGKQGLPIENPKFPFSFITKDGIRFIACILGDGCIHEKGLRYYNKTEELIDNFIYLSRKVFGNISYRKYMDKNKVIAISLPEICKKIIECVGLTTGRKSTKNMRIPKFVFSLSNEKKLEFVSQLIDDDGYINDGNIGIDLGFDESNYPFLIYDLQKLLNTLEINSSVFPISEYYSRSGTKRRMWRLGIFTFKDAKRLGQSLKLVNPNKNKCCNGLLTLKRKEIYKNLDKYLQKMKEIEMAKGFFSTVDLANTTNRSIRHSRRIISVARRLRLIKLIKPACKGYKNISYATYQMVR